jgi:hypothetical protein
MVKKIKSSSSASKAAAASATAEILKTKATSEVGAVKDVSRTSAMSGASRVRQATRPMTASERADLLNLVRDEAGKLFASNKSLSSVKKETLELAVQMALNSSAIDEEDK